MSDKHYNAEKCGGRIELAMLRRLEKRGLRGFILVPSAEVPWIVRRRSVRAEGTES